MIDDILVIVRYDVFSEGVQRVAANLILTVADAAGTGTAIILLVAVKRGVKLGGWLAPKALPALLLVTTLAGSLAWRVEYLSSSLGPQYQYYNGTTAVDYYVFGDYPNTVFAVLALLLAVFVGLYGLALKDRALGGGLLLGWSVVLMIQYIVYATSQYHFTSTANAFFVIAGVCLGLSVLGSLGYAYLPRRDNAATG
jgi:hypothetical protein